MKHKNNIQCITKKEFEALLPYQPDSDVIVGESLIETYIYGLDGKLILIRKIGRIVDLVCYYKVV